MGHIHQVLRWANRREVAREVTRRGYRVSGETLNRWVRDEAEFPAVVERIVFELFGIGAQEESPPAWAEGLVDDAVTRIVTLLGGTDHLEAAGKLLEHLEGIPPPPHEAPPAGGGSPGRAGAEPRAR